MMVTLYQTVKYLMPLARWFIHRTDTSGVVRYRGSENYRHVSSKYNQCMTMKQHNVHVKNGEAQGWHTLYNDHFVTTLIQQL